MKPKLARSIRLLAQVGIVALVVGFAGTATAQAQGNNGGPRGNGGDGDSTVSPLPDGQNGYQNQDGSIQVIIGGYTEGIGGPPGDAEVNAGIKALLQFLLKHHLRCIEVNEGGTTHEQLVIDANVTEDEYKMLGVAINNAIPHGA